MNGNDHSAALRGKTDRFATLLSSIRCAWGRIRQQHFAQWGGTMRAAAHHLTLTVAVAGAGQAQAQAIPQEGWARISPNSGYGFGSYMEVGRSRGQGGTAPCKYDLLYADQAQSLDSQTSHRALGNRSTTVPIVDSKVEPVLRDLGDAGVMTVALGLSEAVPMMVFTGAISKRCIGQYPDCSGDRRGDVFFSQPGTP